MKIFYFVFFIYIIPFSAFAGGENLTAGAQQAAMGGTSATAQDVFSAHNNPAGLAFVEKMSFGLYADRPFLVTEINNFNLSTAIPVDKIGSFGVDVNFLGYSAYNETQAGISYARRFGDKVSAGVKFDYLRLAIRNNGAKNTFAFGVGVQYQALKVLRIGAYVYNPVATTLDKTYKEKVATSFHLGLSYLPSKQFIISLEAEKELNEKARFKAGIEYKPIKQLFLRIGAATNPTLISLGLGTAFKRFRIDVAASWHLQIGITPQVAVIYQISKKQKSE